MDGFFLDMIEKGPLEEELRKKAEEIGANINFLDLVPNEKFPTIINQS